MKSKKMILLPVLILFFFFIVFYTYQIVHFGKYFLPNTVADDVNISNLTLDEANKKLNDAFDKEDFEILDNGKLWQSVPKKELGIKNDFKPALEKGLKKQNKWFWWLAADTKINASKANFDEKTLKNVADSLKPELTKLNAGRTPTVNATIEKGTDAFVITPEKIGNSLNVDTIVATLQKSITEGKNSFELEDHIDKPTVLSDNAELKTKLADMNKIIVASNNYTISGNTFEIPKATIMSWVKYDGTNVTLDQEAVTAYVTELGTTYNTSTIPLNFASTRQGTVSVPAGSYSWSIQTEAEVSELSKEILTGAGFTRTPITEGSTGAATPLIGNTYIEVDLANQHMWYYKDGVVQLETDIVTGKPSTPTPTGVFYVWNKTRNTVLRGEDYAIPVDYWMPIDWTGVGIHDSPWNSNYGGNLYVTGGSHGCVNTPPSVVAVLYDSIDVGMPVVVL